jgi:carbon storage regulator
MLVLSRKEGERIVIGQSITITVVDTHGGKVRLGIAAPQGIAIHREEILRCLLTQFAAEK